MLPRDAADTLLPGMKTGHIFLAFGKVVGFFITIRGKSSAELAETARKHSETDVLADVTIADQISYTFQFKTLSCWHITFPPIIDTADAMQRDWSICRLLRLFNISTDFRR